MGAVCSGHLLVGWWLELPFSFKISFYSAALQSSATTSPHLTPPLLPSQKANPWDIREVKGIDRHEGN